MLPKSEPRGQLSGMLWLGGAAGREKLMGVDENNSRGEGFDPSPRTALTPSPWGPGLCPLHSFTQLMPHTPPPEASAPPLIV